MLVLSRTLAANQTNAGSYVALEEPEGVVFVGSLAAGFDSVAEGLDSVVFESGEATESPAGFSVELDPPAGFEA
jgi:hypothetical protein